jgi:hypothetical protein
MTLRTTAFIVGLLGSLPGAASAAITFNANLTHDQEVGVAGTTPTLTSTGAPRPLSFGTATLVLNDAQTELSLSVTITNIDVTGSQTPDTFDNLVNAHIHAPAPPGTNGGVVWGFFGAPDNDNNPDNLVLTPFVSGVGGTFTSIWNVAEGNSGTTLTAQVPNLVAGLAYLNFHTIQFPGGEIRGQIVPQGVPDSGATAVLLAAALLPLLGLRRRLASRGN